MHTSHHPHSGWLCAPLSHLRAASTSIQDGSECECRVQVSCRFITVVISEPLRNNGERWAWNFLICPTVAPGESVMSPWHECSYWALTSISLSVLSAQHIKNLDILYWFFAAFLKMWMITETLMIYGENILDCNIKRKFKQILDPMMFSCFSDMAFDFHFGLVSTLSFT